MTRHASQFVWYKWVWMETYNLLFLTSLWIEVEFTYSYLVYTHVVIYPFIPLMLRLLKVPRFPWCSNLHIMWSLVGCFYVLFIFSLLLDYLDPQVVYDIFISIRWECLNFIWKSHEIFQNNSCVPFVGSGESKTGCRCWLP